MSNVDVVVAARSYVGVKYLHGGRSRHGVDCAGLLVLVARDLGIEVSDASPGYPRHPDGTLMSYLKVNGDEINPDEAGPGDVIVYWFDRASREPQHVGIRTESGGLIHCWSEMGGVVEVSRDSLSSRRTAAAFRFRRR